MKAHRELLIDSNLLLLLLVARIGPDLIGRCPRTEEYTRFSLELLLAELSRFQSLVTTPNILTEVSNLSRKIPEHLRNQLRVFLAAWLELSREECILSRSAVGERSYVRLGLTDAAITVLARQGATVLTADLGLYLELSDLGADVINFNHLRTAAGDLPV